MAWFLLDIDVCFVVVVGCWLSSLLTDTAFFKTDFFYVEINSYRRNIPGDSTPRTHHLTTYTSAKHRHHDSLNPAATAHHIHIIQPNTSIIFIGLTHWWQTWHAYLFENTELFRVDDNQHERE